MAALLLFILSMTISSITAMDESEMKWLHIKQYNCLINMELKSLNLAQQQYYYCVLHATTPCIQDTTSYSHDSSVQLYNTYCGIIDRFQLKTLSMTWTVFGNPAILLRFLIFSLSHANWKCREDRMVISHKLKVDKFCGFRYPWQMHAVTRKLLIIFKSENKATYFKFQFISFPRHHDTQRLIVIRNSLVSFEQSILSSSHHTVYHFYTAQKTNNIRVNITAVSCETTITCHDGPGTKSPRLVPETKYSLKHFTSTAFHLVCILQSVSCHSEAAIGPLLNMTYSASQRAEWTNAKPRERHACKSFRFYSSIGWGNELYLGDPPMKRCSIESRPRFSSLSYNLSRLSVLYFSMSDEAMLIEDEACIYGGLFILNQTKADQWQEIVTHCNPSIPFPITNSFQDNTPTFLVLFVSFEGYSVETPEFYLEVYHTLGQKVQFSKADKDIANPNGARLSMIPPQPAISYAISKLPKTSFKIYVLTFITAEWKHGNDIRFSIYHELGKCIKCSVVLQSIESNFLIQNSKEINVEAFQSVSLSNIQEIVVDETRCNHSDIKWEVSIHGKDKSLHRNSESVVSTYGIVKDHDIRLQNSMSISAREIKEYWWHIQLFTAHNIATNATWKMSLMTTCSQTKITLENIVNQSSSYLYDLSSILQSDSGYILLTGFKLLNVFFQFQFCSSVNIKSALTLERHSNRSSTHRYHFVRLLEYRYGVCICILLHVTRPLNKKYKTLFNDACLSIHFLK